MTHKSRRFIKGRAALIIRTFQPSLQCKKVRRDVCWVTLSSFNLSIPQYSQFVMFSTNRILPGYDTSSNNTAAVWFQS